jgi:glutaminase
MDTVGYPAKSGVSGLLMIVIPGVMGIGIVSPPLNKFGNSVKGIKTAQLISKLLK